MIPPFLFGITSCCLCLVPCETLLLDLASVESVEIKQYVRLLSMEEVNHELVNDTIFLGPC